MQTGGLLLQGVFRGVKLVRHVLLGLTALLNPRYLAKASRDSNVDQTAEGLADWYLKYRKCQKPGEGLVRTPSEVFGLYVKAIRCRLSLSKEDLAERIGVDANEICLLEQGLLPEKRMSSPEFLAMLGNALNHPLGLGQDETILSTFLTGTTGSPAGPATPAAVRALSFQIPGNVGRSSFCSVDPSKEATVEVLCLYPNPSSSTGAGGHLSGAWRSS